MLPTINDDAVFFEGFFEHLLDFQCEEVVIGGDFNLVLNQSKKRQERWCREKTQ